jgi:hypothetical protein
VGGVIAQSPSGAWSTGGAVLTFLFPMLLFILVAVGLYVLYTKPEVAPGHQIRPPERPVSYTAEPGPPQAPGSGPGQAFRTEGAAAKIDAGPVAATSSGEAATASSGEAATASSGEAAAASSGEEAAAASSGEAARTGDAE